MKTVTANVLLFPTETATPVTNADIWVMCLEHTCPKLDPINVIVRERGKPARSMRIEAEALLEEPRRVKPPADADWSKVMEKARKVRQ